MDNIQLQDGQVVTTTLTDLTTYIAQQQELIAYKQNQIDALNTSISDILANLSKLTQTSN